MTPAAQFIRRLAVKQRVCPSPRRHLQRLALEKALTSGLDVGCGESSLLSPLRAYGFRSTGTDISQTMLDSARARDLHDAYILGDIAASLLPESFDVVVLSHVIEHVSRQIGLQVLTACEKAARRLIYVETPNGFREQPSAPDNPFQRHLSGWLPDDFRRRGYAVYGSGIRGLRGIAGASRLFPEPLTRLLERAAQHVIYRSPHLAGTISAIAKRESNGRLGPA